jgi:hypothetical protein
VGVEAQVELVLAAVRLAVLGLAQAETALVVVEADRL